MIKQLDRLEVITLFAEDLAATKAFYRDVFGLAPIFEDEVSAAMRFGSILINVLLASEAPELTTPIAIGAATAGPRALLTIEVEDTDAVCAELANHGVKIVNGPIDRPWGRRTAAFADPAGNVWEIAQVLRGPGKPS